MKRIPVSVSTVAFCAAVALPLLAAEKLNVNTGLWETTTTRNIGGMTIPALAALPPEVLANVPPGQLTQMERAMKAGSWHSITARACVTEKDLADGAFRQQSQQDMKCSFTVVSNTSKRQVSTFQCSSPAGPADGRLTVDVVDAGLLKGTMLMKTQRTSVETSFDAKWVGADCGATK